MAASSDPYEVLGSTRGKENFVRLSRLLVCGGTAIVKEVFDRLCPPKTLASVLSDKETKDKLRAQRFRKIHWAYLYPPSGGCGNSKEFIPNLLLKLLWKKEFCNVEYPVKGYKLPEKDELGFKADLARIKYYYHSVFKNVKVNMEITDDEFPLLWKEISGALLGLVKHFQLENQCAWKEAIDNLLKESLTEGKVPPQDPYEVLGSTRGKENFLRLSRLLVCGGTVIVREVFDGLCPPHELASALSNEETKAKLKAQRFRNIQWAYLYPPSGGCGKSEEFNLNLLLKLLWKKEFCNIEFPVKGYKLPKKGDFSIAADLARIKYYYHSVFKNVKVNMEITDDEFPLLWEEISGALLRLVKKHFRLEDQCAWKEAIADLLKKSLTEGKVPPQEMEDFDSKPAEESIDEEHAASLEHTEDSTYSDGNSVSLIAVSHLCE